MQTLPYVYGFAPAVAIILVLIWREAARLGFRRERVAAAMAACAAGAVIGSKVLMLDFHAAQYGEKTFLGAVIGGVLTLAIVARVLRFDTRAFDVPVFPVLYGAAIGRIGCFVSGCCHGLETAMPWGVQYAHLPAPVHPTQLYEAALDLGLALLLTRQRARLAAPGQLALAGAAGVAAIRFAIDPLRATAVDGFGPLTVVQWSTLAIVVAALTTLALRSRRGSAAPVVTAPHNPTLVPALVLAGVSLIAFITHDWLTPLEMMLVAGVLFAGAAVVAHAAMPRVIYASPLVGATAFMPIAPADTLPDGRPRSWIAIGGSAMFGGYDVRTDDCAGNTTLQKHRYKVAGVTAEVYQQSRPGVGIGARLTGFRGTDVAPTATAVTGAIDPLRDAARNDRISGATAAATFDGKWVGASLGFTSGHWAWKDERPIIGRVPSQLTAVGAFRVGKLYGFHSELEVGTFEPAPAPGPAARLMIGIGDTLGNRLRVGAADASFLITGRLISKAGFEFEPSVSFGGVDERPMLALSLKKRFYRLP